MRAWGAMVALLGLAGAALAAPQVEFDPAAAVSFPSLEVPRGVRATGMGEAYTAVGDDIYALQWNPAGLASLRELQLGMADNQWNSALGARQDMLSYGQGLGDGAGAAVSLDYFGLGQLEQRDANGGLLGSSVASVLGGSLGYGQSFLAEHRLKAGLSLEYVQQDLYSTVQSAFGGGLGLLYDLRPGLTAGLAVVHLGPGLPGFNLPSSAQAGLALRLPDPHLTLALDAQLPFAGAPLLKGGLELEVSAVCLRAGYRQALGGAEGALQSGLSAGAGFKVGLLRLDYSYTPYGELSTVHRVQATVVLPGDFFHPHALVAEGTTVSAQAYYDLGKSLEAQGQTLKALVQYQRSAENYPEALRSQPQPFYLDAVKKVEQLQADLAKGGDHQQINRLSKESLIAADRDAKAGRLREALARLKEAQHLDPADAELKAAYARLAALQQAKVQGFRDAALAAIKNGDLAKAVDQQRRVLAQDPEDPTALAFLAQHRQELKALLQTMDQRAIFAYVGGKLEAAIKLWSDGEALDYFGDVNFKRNLDKARKQLELRGAAAPAP